MRAFLRAAAFLGAAMSMVQPALADEHSEIETCANAAEQSQSLRRTGKLTDARKALLVCSRPTCPAFVRKDCTGWLADVERILPSIVVRAVDAKGKDLTNVRITVDGIVLAESLDGRPVAIDPGQRTLSYEADGLEPVTEKLLIRQGETNRLVSVTFSPPQPSSPPSSADDARKPSGGIPVLSWILGGAGVALAGGGVAFWASGTSDHSSMESGCATTRSCAQSDVDSAQTKLLVGDIALGAGIVAIGAAVIIALTSKSPTAQTATRLDLGSGLRLF